MKAGYYRPFEKLSEITDASNLKPVEEKYSPPDIEIPDSATDEEAFAQAMRDVRPLGWSAAPDPPLPLRLESSEENETEAERLLREFVSGRGGFDLHLTGEYVEGRAQAAPRWLLDELHRGRFSVQAELDLHGMRLEEAKRQVERFIIECARAGLGCVRIVHGRGQHSADGRAVLKEQVPRWLSTRRMSRRVVAFASARPCDGGAGALYVLLRRAKYWFH